jgi:hypothetical protein
MGYVEQVVYRKDGKGDLCEVGVFQCHQQELGDSFINGNFVIEDLECDLLDVEWPEEQKEQVS